MTPEHIRLSKRMSYVLRHNPAEVGLKLDAGGWIDFDEFVAALQQRSPAAVPRALIIEIVETSEKQRFELTGGRIRAAQGHSIEIDLGLEPLVPPSILWHGTVHRFVSSILVEGLVRKERSHVHLSDSIGTARAVGTRRGTPVILEVDAARMHQSGGLFYRTANGVWLTDAVRPHFITIVDPEDTR